MRNNFNHFQRFYVSLVIISGFLWFINKFGVDFRIDLSSIFWLIGLLAPLYLYQLGKRLQFSRYVRSLQKSGVVYLSQEFSGPPLRHNAFVTTSSFAFIISISTYVLMKLVISVTWRGIFLKHVGISTQPLVVAGIVFGAIHFWAMANGYAISRLYILFVKISRRCYLPLFFLAVCFYLSNTPRIVLIILDIFNFRWDVFVESILAVIVLLESIVMIDFYLRDFRNNQLCNNTSTDLKSIENIRRIQAYLNSRYVLYPAALLFMYHINVQIHGFGIVRTVYSFLSVLIILLIVGNWK